MPCSNLYESPLIKSSSDYPNFSNPSVSCWGRKSCSIPLDPSLSSIRNNTEIATKGGPRNEELTLSWNLGVMYHIFDECIDYPLAGKRGREWAIHGMQRYYN